MQQIPCIQLAKDMGCYVITCDYLPNNSGHRLADEYHNISTVDKEKVCELARELEIDGIVAYASDPAAPTAAYVSEQLGIPGNPYESVRILTNKHLFRQFLREHHFNCPNSIFGTSYEEILSGIGRLKFPIMVKPVDSSGSKGVVKVYSADGLKDAFDEAISYSRSKTVIAEEFIVKKGYQVSGDGFSVNGKFVFSSYGNELYSGNGTREHVALVEFWPSLLTMVQKEKVDGEIQRLITELGMRSCAYNIEVILDKDDNVYIIELGPRNGGSYIPQLIKYATGVDLIDYTIKASLGEDCSDLKMAESSGFWSNYMILSKKDGIFDRIEFDEKFRNENLLECHCTCSEGEEVHKYQNTTHSLGTILFKADSLEEMKDLIENIDNCYKVVLK